MNKVYIYSLKCPMTGHIKYIGQTMYTLQQRLSAHICSPANEQMKAWIKSLDNSPPIIEEIEMVDTCDADLSERYWIAQFKQWGFKLLNKISPPKNQRRKRQPHIPPSDTENHPPKFQIDSRSWEQELTEEMMCAFVERDDLYRELKSKNELIAYLYQELKELEGFYDKRNDLIRFNLYGFLWEVKIRESVSTEELPSAMVAKPKTIN